MPEQPRPPTLLCIASYFKGGAFLETCKQQGCRVFLITSEKLKDEPWPRDSLDDIFYVPGDRDAWSLPDLIRSVSYLARHEPIDRIVALDDFDLEKAAALREHLRVPGMGDTRTRYFRDKLAMRMRAQEAGIAVPPFVHVLNHDRVRAFTEQVPPPWVIKPRSQASAMGIKKIHDADALWRHIEALGDEQSFFLLERFVPGDIYHVDSVVFGSTVRFARAHRYIETPIRVAQEGGIFCSHTVAYGSPVEDELLAMNAQVAQAMGLLRGVSHTEFIKADEDGAVYFLETSARVGGAHIAEMVEASSGINLWRAWAWIETLPHEPGDQPFHLPEPRHDYAGIIISLARQEYPDLSAYADPEVVWRLHMKHHAGLIISSDRLDRVEALLAAYTPRFFHDFHTTVPLPDRAGA